MRRRLFKGLSIALMSTALVAFVFTSCEGPMGPAGETGAAGPAGAIGATGSTGAAGATGADGNVTCLDCHDGDAMAAIQGQFNGTGHKAGLYVGYAGGRNGCSQCHGSEGFINFATFGTGGAVNSPSVWECKTCHGIHSEFVVGEYALRKTDFTFVFDATVTADLGTGNLCANCHQSRRAGPVQKAVGVDSAAITSTHYGPHHGPQANVVAGVGFAEIVGSKTYPVAGTNMHFTTSCTGCHMGTAYDATAKEGGHTWTPLTSACNTCHTGTALTADYDYDGFQTEMGLLLDEIRDTLVSLHVVHYEEAGTWEWDADSVKHIEVDIESGYHPIVGEYSLVEVQAFFNWVGLAEDKSLGAHNPKYFEALLVNTLEALKLL
jgi:hypothetical protein